MGKQAFVFVFVFLTCLAKAHDFDMNLVDSTLGLDLAHFEVDVLS